MVEAGTTFSVLTIVVCWPAALVVVKVVVGWAFGVLTMVVC